MIAVDDLAALVVGAVDLRHESDGVVPLRLPGTARRDFPGPGIDWISTDAAGVRLRFVTAATAITLEATFTRNRARVRPAWPIVLVCAGQRVTLDEGTMLVVDVDGSVTTEPGGPSVVRFDIGGDGAPRIVELWLPHTAQVLLHSLSADASIEPAPAPDAPVWIHHGSSISHGLETDGPLASWPMQASRALGLELLNLGFAGNAMLDPFVARAIAARPADVITLKLGINIVNGAAMTERTFVPALHGFLDLVREGHPTTPVALVTAIACPIHEETAGPTVEESPGRFSAAGTGTLTLARTRSLIGAVVAARADPQLHLVDGLGLFGPDDAGLLYDNLHPDQAGHDLMASRFAALARSGDGPLGAAFASVLR